MDLNFIFQLFKHLMFVKAGRKYSKASKGYISFPIALKRYSAYLYLLTPSILLHVSFSETCLDLKYKKRKEGGKTLRFLI